MAKFLIDENVPHSISVFLEDKGHDVIEVKKVLLEGTPDPVISQVAHELESIVVTWNIKDFKNDIKKYKLGLLAFRCEEHKALERLNEEYDYIEFEIDICVKHRKKFWVEIQKTGLKFYRPDKYSH